MKRRDLKQSVVFFVLMLLGMPILHASLTVETLSPSYANLCGTYSQNISISAQKVQNTGNQTIENVTATLVAEPNNGGISIIGPSLYLGSITPGILSVDPSWQVQCEDLPGIYTLYVNFSNAQGSLGSSQEEAVSKVSMLTVHANDGTSPTILSHSPTGVIPTSYVTLEVITDEDAICRYSTIPGVAYANQPYSFQITGGKSHKVSLQNLVDNFYNHYIRCKDAAGNEAPSDYVVSLEINAPPTAMLMLSKSSPLSAGTTEVTIATSEPVKPVPSLSYSCNNGNSVSVPLTGSGSSWRGYIIVNQANVNEVCSFSFSSMDLSGNTGAYITNGNIFLIDTQPPGAPTGLSAAELRGLSVKLSWKLPLEEIKHFNIYRLSDESPEFSYLGTATKNSFADATVSIGKTYVYSVSAVDEAGNEGPFSGEASILIKGISLDEAVAAGEAGDMGDTPVKTRLTLAEIDSSIAEADALLEEFNILRTKFKPAGELDEVSLLLEPSERIKEAKVLLLKKKEELGILKSANLAEVDIRETFLLIRDELDAVKHKIISGLELGKEELFTNEFSEEQMAGIIASYLDKEKISMSQEERVDFLSSVKSLQDTFVITSTSRKIQVAYLNGTVETLTLIKKEFSKKEGIDSSEDLLFIEYIPKELASSVDEMILGPEVEVLDPDPLLAYPYSGDTAFSYSYFLKKRLSPPESAKILTVTAPKMTSGNTPKTNAVESAGSSWDFLTGNAVVSLVDKISFYDAGITIGIILIVIIFIYSLIYSEKEISFKIQHDFPSFDRIRSYLLKKNRKKQSNTGMIYPYYAHDDYQQAGLTPLLDSTLSVLLKKTEDALHALDFEKAVKFYHLFNIQHDSASSKKEKASPSSRRIKKKMALLTKHTLLQYAVERNEYLNIRQVLNEIAELYNELFPGASEKEMRLLEHAKSSHAKYSVMLMKRK